MSDHEMIGKTVVEYAENGRHAACVKKRLADLGRDLVRLGQALQEESPAITVTGSAFLVQARPPRMVPLDHRDTVAFSTLDPEAIQQTLGDLAETEAAGEALAQTLRGLRLPELIRDA